MEIDEPSSAVDFAVGGPALEKIRWNKPVYFQFGALKPGWELHYSRGALGEVEPAVLTIGTSLKEPHETEEETPELVENTENPRGFELIPVERYLGEETMSVTQEGRRVMTFQMPNLVPALTALNQCAEGFIEYWGLDLAKHRTMKSGPHWTNFKTVVRRYLRDYPSDAVRRGEQGSVRFVVIVDETGKVVECRQSDATVLDRLESGACKGMERATFEPALDADGQPMRSYYATKIRYVLP